MENLKNFRKALCEAMKADIVRLSKEQKQLKLQRKLDNRPADKVLWQIQNEIDRNAGKITTLINFYRWTKHSMQYWEKRNVTYFNDFLFYWGSGSTRDDRDIVWHYIKHDGKDVKSYVPLWCWRMYCGINHYIEYCKKYNIEYDIATLQKILFNVR